MTNEAKSSLSERDKKQDKILLSPISTTPATTIITAPKPNFDLFNPSDLDNDKSKPSEIEDVKPVIIDNDADNQKEVKLSFRQPWSLFL